MCENGEKVKSKLLKHLLATNLQLSSFVLSIIIFAESTIKWIHRNKVCVRDLWFGQNINYVRIIIENIVFLPK